MAAAMLMMTMSLLASGKLLPEAHRRAQCFLGADWTLQAGEAMRAGVAEERHLEAAQSLAPADRESRRAAIAAVYRDRPRDLSDYIAARLGACLRDRGERLGDHLAKACYDQTLWAGTMFDSKRRGVRLEQLIEGYARSGMPLAGLAEAVYLSPKPEPEFRRDLFLECLAKR